MHMMLFLGIFLVVLGIVNVRGNISTIHWYNRRRVSEVDRPSYGRYMGAGTIVVGGTLVLVALLQHLLGEIVTTAIVLVGCAVGIALMLYAQFKYNKGIF